MKREMHNRSSRRGLVVRDHEGKRSQLSLDAKDRQNELGIGESALRSDRKQNKKARTGSKKVVSTVYQYRTMRVKQPDAISD